MKQAGKRSRSRKNCKNNTIYFIALFTIIATLPVISLKSHNVTRSDIQSELQSSYIVHGKITLNGDAELGSFENITDGDGSEGHPYIIEGLSIDSGESGSAIDIQGTTKHLVIRDCLFTNSGSNWKDSGIYLYNTKNITIERCISHGNINGMFFEQTNNCTLKDCDLYSNERGFQLYQADRNIIKNNTIWQNTQYGIDFSGASDDWNIFEWNNISFNEGVGISYYGTNLPNWVRYNHIANNSDYGIEMADSDQNIYLNNITGNQNGGIRIHSGTNNTFSFNNITDNDVGDYEAGIEISSFGTSYNKIYNNTISGHHHDFDNPSGIRITSNAYSNMIYNNTILDNDVGIYDYLANNTIIESNDISANGVGVSICKSENITIDDNYMFKNTGNAVYLKGLLTDATIVKNISIINNRIHNTT
ncbi:MAG: hypothetical protein GF364_17110, partial [Candidatus Lokiarchaeota archaeon]|nr:hypothetical protein [Candidatus Lokiarchaeota archaeon]